MTRFALIPVAILAMVLLAGPASADTIYLKSGETVRGKVLELSEKEIALSLEGLPGSRVSIPISRVSDYSLYEARKSRIDPGSVEELEALGDWAAQRKLLAFAMEAYGAALEEAGEDASPELEPKLEEASSQCGADKLTRAKRLVDEGNLQDAVRFFRDILKNHATCPAAPAAKEQIGVLRARIKEQRAGEKRAARTAEDVEKVKDAVEAAHDLIARGLRLRKLGLEESGSLGKAEDDFQAAIRAYTRAAKVVERARKLPNAAELEAEFKALETHLVRRLVDVYVDIGHNYIVKGNLIRANHYMGLSLALDPDNPKALALRSAIAYSTSNDRWGRPTSR